MNVFLHIGGDFSVRVGEILSIYDYDAMKASEAGRAFLRKRERTLVDISDGRPKSAVVTDRNIYLSTRNIPDVLLATPSTINVYDIMNANKLVLTRDAVQKIEEVYA